MASEENQDNSKEIESASDDDDEEEKLIDGNIQKLILEVYIS